MKNLRHNSNFFQYTAIAIAPPAIGNKGFVVSKTQRFFPLPSTDLHVCDRFSELKEVAMAFVRYTPVSPHETRNTIKPLDFFMAKGMVQYIPKKRVLKHSCKDIRGINTIKVYIANSCL